MTREHPEMATKMKFKAGKAKNTKKVKENLKKGANYGRMLWVAADTSKVVRMLVEPKDWEEYSFYVVEKTDDGKNLGFRGKVPEYEGIEDAVPETGRLNPRIGYVIPVVVIEDGKPQDRVMFWEPGKKMLNELLTIFEKRKTLTDRDVEIIREGSGRDTTYTLYWDDPKKATLTKALKIAEADGSEFADELVNMVKDFEALYAADGAEDDEEDEPKAKKAKGKSAAAKKRAMVDDEEDDEDEESEEEAEEADDEEDDEAEEEAEDDEDEEEAEDALTGSFEITGIDADAFTIDMVHVDSGQVLETVYLDRTRDDIEALEEGAVVTTTVSKDEEDDWTVDTVIKPAAKSKKKAPAKKVSAKKK